MWYNRSVITNFPSSAIALTYKGKLLLLSPDIDAQGVEQSLWRFIGGIIKDPESSEQTIQRKVKYTTKLKLKNIQRLSSARRRAHFYHGELTDDDVNSIERREGERLEFYTLNELEKLTLTETTGEFLAEYKSTVEKLLTH